MKVLLVVTVCLVQTSLGQCLTDGEYCYDDESCCAGVCSHHWPPTTTPVFGVCGSEAPCQQETVWCRDGWDDATCCPGLVCVNIEGQSWGYCFPQRQAPDGQMGDSS